MAGNDNKRNEYQQIVDKLDNTYYPTPMVFDDNVPDEAFADAQRGFIEGTALTDAITSEPTGRKVWDMASYSFIEGPCPATVHKNLWRMEQLNNYNGIFQVLPYVADSEKGTKDGIIYQARSYDLATMSFIKSKNGWIIIDPLTGTTTATYAWKKFKEHIDANAELRAIIITHSHVDHYKGVEGLIASENKKIQQSYEEKTGINDHEVLVVAPDGFYDESISENLYLGNCMSRRAQYMYGGSLPRSITGHVGSGLGKTVSEQAGSIPVPTIEVKEATGEEDVKMSIDGLSFIFKNYPGTEAPSEMHVYIKDYNTLCPGENITQTMHNLLTPRGAKVRDPKAMAEAIDDAITRFPDTKVIIGTHHWPTWNIAGKDDANNKCLNLMEKQRDMYLFFNNQVIHMLNSGYNMEEIANNFVLPKSLMNEFYCRGYYGSLNHNAKAVAQRYIGWWDGNPANYFKYTDVEIAQRFVADMGGESSVLRKAHDYFERKDYRWTVELTRQIVFANPQNTEARNLEADALEQLAYSFEAGTWRNIFLAGAFELRGYMQAPRKNKDELLASIHANLKGLSGEYILDYLSILIDGNKVIEAEKDSRTVTCYFDLSIGSYNARVNFSNGVLHYDEIAKAEQNSPICFQTETDFADYVYFNLLGGVVNTSYDQLDKVLSFIEIQNNVWNIIEPIETNNKENMTTRKINVCMPENGYISWFVTTQNGFPTKVELSDSEGNVYFSSEKKKPQDTSIDPPLAQGSGFIKGCNLTLTVEINSNQRYELKGTPVLYDIKDENGVVTGKSFSMAFEDYIDNDYNDIYVNIVGWNNKG